MFPVACDNMVRTKGMRPNGKMTWRYVGKGNDVSDGKEGRSLSFFNGVIFL